MRRAPASARTSTNKSATFFLAMARSSFTDRADGGAHAVAGGDGRYPSDAGDDLSPPAAQPGEPGRSAGQMGTRHGTGAPQFQQAHGADPLVLVRLHARGPPSSAPCSP